jgi:hypothetical protein
MIGPGMDGMDGWMDGMGLMDGWINKDAHI